MKKTLFILGFFSAFILGACDSVKNVSDEVFEGSEDLYVNFENNEEPDLDLKREYLSAENHRIKACEERTSYLLNAVNITFEWKNEDEGGASFYREGKATYTKNDGIASEDVICFIDMVDASVNVEFGNHQFEGVEFYPEDDEDTLNEKWESYVNNYIAIDNDVCETSVFVSDGEEKYGTYYCVQTSSGEGDSDYSRSGIYNIFADEWLLTCNEANGEQGVGYDENLFGKQSEEKTCLEYLSYIEEQIR